MEDQLMNQALLSLKNLTPVMSLGSVSVRFSLETTHVKAKPLANLFKDMFGCLKEVGFSQSGSNRNTLMRGIIESSVCGA